MELSIGPENPARSPRKAFEDFCLYAVPKPCEGSKIHVLMRRI